MLSADHDVAQVRRCSRASMIACSVSGRLGSPPDDRSSHARLCRCSFNRCLYSRARTPSFRRTNELTNNVCSSGCYAGRRGSLVGRPDMRGEPETLKTFHTEFSRRRLAVAAVGVGPAAAGTVPPSGALWTRSSFCGQSLWKRQRCVRATRSVDRPLTIAPRIAERMERLFFRNGEFSPRKKRLGST